MYRFDHTYRNMHIILDCDDVLLDWIGGFSAFVEMQTGTRPDPAGPTAWGMGEWLGLQADAAFELVQAFNASESFGQLDARFDALLTLPALRRMGHKLTVLTSCSDDPVVMQRRRDNLSLRFGDIFEQVICIPLGQSKKTWLNILERGLWIEDNYSNGAAGHGCGHRTFMLRRSHNRAQEMPGDPIVTWVDDLRPIVSLFN